jgi:hypothetical protein
LLREFPPLMVRSAVLATNGSLAISAGLASRAICVAMLEGATSRLTEGADSSRPAGRFGQPSNADRQLDTSAHDVQCLIAQNSRRPCMRDSVL